MRRSSWVIIGVAVLLLGGLLFLRLYPLDTYAKPIDKQFVNTMMQQARDAMESRSADQIIALTSPDAKILGVNREDTRIELRRALSQMGPEPVELKWENVDVMPTGPTTTVSFNLSVGQHGKTEEATYYHSHITLEFKKMRILRWFGLFSNEEWKIVTVTGDLPSEGP